MKDSLIESLKNLLFDSLDKEVSASFEEASFKENKANNLSLDDYNEISKTHGVRIFSEEECLKLDTHCRDFILYSEQLGILSPIDRETIIDKLMQSESSTVTKEELKWTLIEVLDRNLNSDELNFLDFILSPEKAVAH